MVFIPSNGSNIGRLSCSRDPATEMDRECSGSHRMYTDVGNCQQRAPRLIESALVNLKHRRERFMDAYGDGQITSAELRQQLDRMTEQERKFVIQMEGLQPKRIDRGFVEEILRTFEASWKIADADARKELVRLSTRDGSNAPYDLMITRSEGILVAKGFLAFDDGT